MLSAVQPPACGDARRHLGQAALQQRPHRRREAARRSLDQHLGRDDVGRARGAGRDMAHAQHRRLARRHVSPDDALHRHDELRGDIGRIGAAIGHGAVAAGALEGDLPAVGGRQHGAGADGEAADRDARHVVHAVDGVAVELVEQALLDHHPRAAQPFLGGLEDEVHGAGEIGRRRQMLGRAQQHGGVAVMAAGMHLVGIHRGVVEIVLLLQVQRVHVGAQADRLLARPLALQGADDAGLGQPAMDLDAPGRKPVGHDLGGALLLEGGLRMAMDVAADGGEIGLVGGEEIGRETGHGLPSVGAETSRAAWTSSSEAATVQPVHADGSSHSGVRRWISDPRALEVTVPSAAVVHQRYQADAQHERDDDAERHRHGGGEGHGRRRIGVVPAPADIQKRAGEGEQDRQDSDDQPRPASIGRTKLVAAIHDRSDVHALSVLTKPPASRFGRGALSRMPRQRRVAHRHAISKWMRKAGKTAPGDAG